MEYLKLKSQIFTKDGYKLLPLRRVDIFLIMNWRNEQMTVLRQTNKITKEVQKKYYQNKILPSFSQDTPDIMLFSLLCNDVPIGYGGLTNIDWDSKRAEVSFLLDSTRAREQTTYSQDFTAFLFLLRQVAFEDLGLHRLFTETFDMRPTHVGILEKNGYILEGRMKDHVIIDGKYVDSLIHGLVNN